MKRILKDWEKAVLVFVLLTLGIFSGVFMVHNRKLGDQLDRQSHVSSSVDPVLEAESIPEPEKAPDYGPRDIFSRVEIPSGKVRPARRMPEGEYRFELLDTMYKSFEVNYLGRIVFEDGRMVAQLNYRNRTFLVPEGNRVAGYEVVSIDKDKVTLRRNDQLQNIEFRRPMYTEELTAKIKETGTGQVFVVDQNSEIFGFKVLDIKKDSVLLSNQGQHLSLEKGKVR